MTLQERLWTTQAKPYERPSMANIRARSRNGLTAVGSFSGCGGSSLGLMMAGWEVPYAIEFVDAAADTYELNFPGTKVDRRDIREVQPAEILEHLGILEGELDLFEGSPPCASFSSAGSRTKAWGLEKLYSDGKKQTTDDLFWEWTRLLDGLRPRAFIAENVPGMLNGRALEEYMHKIVAELGNLGYRVHPRIVNSAWYGVPQDRERLLFMGLRDDVARSIGVQIPQFPPQTADEPVTITQGLEAAKPYLDPDEVKECDKQGSKTATTWQAKRDSMDKAGNEPDWLSLPCQRCNQPMREHPALEYSAGGDYLIGGTCSDGEPAEPIRNYFMARAARADEPAPTIVAMSDSFHLTEPRYLATAELLALAGFPHDFQLTGVRRQRRERVGRAVTPPVYEAIGGRIADYLLGRLDEADSAMIEETRPADRSIRPDSRAY